MPLTIVEQPSAGVDQITPTPVYNFIMGEVTSSNVDIVRLRVKATVYSGDSLGSVVIGEPSVTIDPQPDASNDFRFDVQALVRDYVKGYTYEGDSIPTKDAASAWFNKYNSGRTYVIDMTEIVENTAGLLVDGDGDVMNPVMAVNTDTRMTNYTMSVADTGKFLTEYPRTENITIRRNENMYLSGLLHTEIDGTGTSWADVDIDYFLVVETFDSDGTSIQVTNVPLGDGSTKARRFDIGVGTSNLGATITAGTLSYEIYLGVQPPLEETPLPISETLTFKICDDCVDDRNYTRLVWVNSLGGLDFYSFSGETIREVEVDKEVFDQTVRDDSTTQNRGKKTLRTFREHPRTVHSSLLSEAQRLWLQELYEDVLTWEEDNGYRAVSLVTTRQSVVNRIEGIYQMFVEYVEAFPKSRQHG